MINDQLETRIKTWASRQLAEQITRVQAISGGCICHCFRLTTEHGASLFLKYLPEPPDRLFYAEADGLRALANASSLHIPEVISVSTNYLLMEDVQSGALGADIYQTENRAEFWQKLVQGLAGMHNKPMARFGFVSDNYCGTSEQRNPPCLDGHYFFVEYRLYHQMKKAQDRGLINSDHIQQLESICSRLSELIPEQQPSLLHGDLWSGNILANLKGEPALIDPAAYWGWAEADIAMTMLFGGFKQTFYQSYLEHKPLESGWQQRMDLYNLYHLLNHLNLFGKSYLPAIERILKLYCQDTLNK